MKPLSRRSALATATVGSLGGLSLASGCASPGPAPASPAALDLTSAAGQLDAFMRMRASNDGRDTFANWWTTIFVVLPGERPREIMKMDGFNAGRFARRADGGWQFITREVGFYKDSRSGQILETWDNPFTSQKNQVLHIANDPVNSQYNPPQPGEAGRFPFMRSGDDVFCRVDVPLAYPNPLQPAEFPAESSGPMYTASEHFTFFAKASDLANRSLASVPCTWSWSRTGPWLPWMKMGTRPGFVLYSGHGRKFASFAELPADVREYTLKHFPAYQKSPEAFVTPNETSWTYYKKQQRK